VTLPACTASPRRPCRRPSSPRRARTSAPPGPREWAGAEGWYQLTDHPAGTHLAISITLSVELPLARLAAPAVETVIRTSMAVTGSRFASNLDHHLGIRSGTRPSNLTTWSRG
jgi:hypothetical protein